ncbi:MAG: hypothetical protein E6713_04590 [Sporomusaceae bacterium]|nr:hypothetical protein [Sporomusaceae bacterium]
MRYCIFCGVEIPKSALFCQICGKRQPDQTEEMAEAEAEAVETELADPAPPTGLAAFLASPKKLVIAGVGAFVGLIIIVTFVIVVVTKK